MNHHEKAKAVTQAYRTWRSPKTAAKRQEDADRRKKQMELNIAAKAKEKK